MTALLIAVSVVGAGLLGLVLVVRARGSAQLLDELQSFQLQFPRGLEPQAVVSFCASLRGILPPWWRRLLLLPPIMLETRASAEGISHHLLVPMRYSNIVLTQLRATLPGVRVTAEDVRVLDSPARAGELALSTMKRPLRADQLVGSCTSILASMQPLATNEQLVIQWIVTPSAPLRPPRLARADERTVAARAGAVLDDYQLVEHGEAVRELREKQAEPIFLASGRFGVWAETERASQLLARLTSAFHRLDAPGAHLRLRVVPSAWVASRLARRIPPLLVWPAWLNAAELAAVSGFPAAVTQLPGLLLVSSRQLAPASLIPRSGRVVAQSAYPGSERGLALGVLDSLRHLHVIGPTGTGKSTLLLNLITQDLAAGHGLVVVDPKGDLITDCLDRVPDSRIDDVILLDPSDDACPVGLNVLAGAQADRELAVDQVVGTMRRLYAAFWGPRTDDILRAALLTLVTKPGMTLCEVPLLLTNEGFRRSFVANLNEPVALEPFWGWFESMSDAERLNAIGPVLNKVRAFLLRERIRHVIGQANPALNLRDVVDQQKVLLVSLAKGLLGEDAAALLGSLLIAQLWRTVQGRAGMPAEQRRPIFCFVDEFQDYLNLPSDIADVLVQARGLGLSLTLAHQHLGQLPRELQRAVLANARSKVVFQTTAADAHMLAREFRPYLEPEDLQGLGAHEVVVQLMAGGQVTPPATGLTAPPPPALGTAERVRAGSRARYGKPRAEIQAELRARHELRPGAGRVGRSRRGESANRAGGAS